MGRRIVLAIVLATPLACGREDPRPRIQVAASLAEPVEDLLADQVDVSVASSVAIARQLESGMPADLVLLADPQAMDALAKDPGVTLDARATVASNRLVVVVPADEHSNLETPDAWSTGRIAVGDPAAVPLGRYTRQALHATGRWASTLGRQVFGGDARAVLTLIERGEVDLAVVYESDAVGNDRVAILERIDPRLHDEIRCEIAIVGDHPGARSTYERILHGVDWSRWGFAGSEASP